MVSSRVRDTRCSVFGLLVLYLLRWFCLPCALLCVALVALRSFCVFGQDDAIIVPWLVAAWTFGMLRSGKPADAHALVRSTHSGTGVRAVLGRHERHSDRVAYVATATADVGRSGRGTVGRASGGRGIDLERRTDGRSTPLGFRVAASWIGPGREESYGGISVALTPPCGFSLLSHYSIVVLFCNAVIPRLRKTAILHSLCTSAECSGPWHNQNAPAHPGSSTAPEPVELGPSLTCPSTSVTTKPKVSWICTYSLGAGRRRLTCSGDPSKEP